MKFAYRHVSLILLSILVITYSCKQDDSVDINCTPGTVCDDGDPNTSGDIYDEECICTGILNTGFDLGDIIEADIGGRVLDELGQPLSGVTVIAGGKSTVTDDLGVFLILDAFVRENLAYVEATAEGFFEGSRSFLPTAGINKVKIRLLAKQDAGNVDAMTGGQVQSEGVKINLEAGGFVKDGIAYNGQVNVAMNYIDPNDENFDEEMPGMLIGTQDGNGRVLMSFGMVAVELTDGNGDKVDLAPGSPAEMRFPVPSSLFAAALSEIDLWHFDHHNGYWVSEGKAELTGNEYVGPVSHFSHINCDAPLAPACISGRIVDGSGNGIQALVIQTNNSPLANFSPSLGSQSTWTSSTGGFNICGPNSEEWTLTVKANCNGVLTEVYSDDVGPFVNAHSSIGEIAINTSTTIIGTIVDCEGDILYTAYVIADGEIVFMGDGAYIFSRTSCTSDEVTIYPFDNSNGFQSGDPITVQLDQGIIYVDTLVVCENACSDGMQNNGETGVDCGGVGCISCSERCSDGIQNGDETGVDCGGSDCDPCPTCDDGIQNGDETGVDCGGSCDPCPTCDDGIQNGDETGVDCGGSCDACPTCDDGIQNGDETGVDCGGSDCDPCPTCDDGIQNGDETGVDCGGNCDPCPTCDDGIQNGNETDIDCGGEDCPPCPTGTVTDIDGNIYNTIELGSQIWTAENLRVTKYRNGDAIPNITGTLEWANLSSGAFCWYDNDNQYDNPYGKLYNWYAVADSRNLCPTGWHVPTDEEWKILEMYLGMSQEQVDSTDWRGTNEGGKIKEIGFNHWNSPNTGASNESGFTALPSNRTQNGDFVNLGVYGGFWSATEYDAINVWFRAVQNNLARLGRSYFYKEAGLYVRCVKD